MNIDLLKSVDQNILDLVTAKNASLEMTLEQVTIGAASELVDDVSGRNSQVTLTAVANKGFSGTRVIKYNRIALTDGVAVWPEAVSINPEDAIATIKSKIAASLGLMLSELEFSYRGDEGSFDTLEEAEDIIPGILIPENEDDTSKKIGVHVKASGSKLYVGEMEVVQLTVPDADIPLNIAISDDVMDGFDPVVGV